MNGKSKRILKVLGSDDKEGKAMWMNLSHKEKDRVRQTLKKNPKFASYGLPAILEAIKDFT